MSEATIGSATTDRRHGTAWAALRTRAFRIMWLGMLASNIGTWMQTVVLPAYIDRRTESGAMVGLFTFAQLGPLLLLSIPAGVLADRFPRKIWIGTMQMAAAVCSLIMAWFVQRDASVWWLLFVQLVTGVANAMSAPAMQGVVPALVDRVDLPGAVSLNSVGINGSRVVGPVIAAALMARGLSISAILVINAASYLFVLLAMAMVRFPEIGRATNARGIENLLTGIRIVRRRTVLARLLVALTIFSFFSLAFVGLFPAIARTNFGLDTAESSYKWLYATWGLGAMVGALAIGTVFARRDTRRLIPPLLIGFAGFLTVFALLRSPGPAFPVGFMLGFCYFAMVTCMSTVFQENMHNSERARVMALWFMAFGGTVSIGNLALGPVMDAIGATPVLLAGAAVAAGLAWYTNLVRRPTVSLIDEEGDDPLEPSDPASLDQHSLAAGE